MRGSLRRFSRWSRWVLLGALGGGAFLYYQYQYFFEDFSVLRPTTGGIYTESTVGSIHNLNPLAPDHTGIDEDLMNLIFEGLVRYNPLKGQMEGALAEFRIEQDGKTYQTILRHDARFSDGNPVTVEDVLFTYEEVIQHPHFQNEALKKAFEYVTLEVLDDRTVQFTLPEKNVFFLSLLRTPILPRHYFQDALIEEVIDPSYPFNRKPIGAGPYRLKNIIPETNGTYRVFLESHDEYYGETPHIEKLVFYVYPDIEKLKAAENESTVISRIPPSFDKVIQEKLVTEYQKQTYLLPRYLGLFFNLDRPILGKPALRKALHESVDKEGILSKERGWQRIDSPFFFEGIETGFQVKNFLQARRYLREGGFPYRRALQARTVGKTDELLKLTLVTSVSPPSYSRMAQSIARTWEDVLDISVEVQVLEKQAFQEALQNRAYDILLFGNDFTNNFDTLSAWHSSQSGKLNLSNLTREDIDVLISDIRFAGAQTDFFALSQKLDEILPAVMLATPEYFALVSRDLRGFRGRLGKMRSFANRFDHIDHWYFYQEPVLDVGNRNALTVFLRWMVGLESQEGARD